MPETDIQQIGISDFGQQVVSKLCGDVEFRPGSKFKMFAQVRQCYKFAVAVAIKYELSPIEDVSFKTSQDGERLDPDGRLRSLIGYVYPDRKDQFRLSQGLAEAGFRLISEKLDKSETFNDISGLI